MMLLDPDYYPFIRDEFVRRLPDDAAVNAGIYRPFRENDTQIRTRLPDIVWRFLGDAAESQFISRADLARELVFCNLYGRFDLMVMKSLREGLYFSGRREADAGFAGVVNNEPVELLDREDFPMEFDEPRRILGNNDREFLLSMPKFMSEDVVRVAQSTRRTPGRALRKMIIREFFGRRFNEDALRDPRD